MTELATYTNCVKREETLLFMAGPLEVAQHIIQKFCDEVGWCISVDQTGYIYTGGFENGFVIRAINYPRFPNTDNYDRMRSLAELLQVELKQDSYTIHHGDQAFYFSNSAKDA